MCFFISFGTAVPRFSQKFSGKTLKMHLFEIQTVRAVSVLIEDNFQ